MLNICMADDNDSFRMTVLGYSEGKKVLKARIDSAPYMSWTGKSVFLRADADGANKIARSLRQEDNSFSYSPDALVAYFELNHPGAAMKARERADSNTNSLLESAAQSDLNGGSLNDSRDDTQADQSPIKIEEE